MARRSICLVVIVAAGLIDGLPAGKHNHTASWHYTRDGHLFATLDVLDGFDEQHRLVALRDATSIWLDIGINTSPTPFPGRTFRAFGQNPSFYLGFEPLIDKFALNLARGVRHIERTPLGKVTLPLPNPAAQAQHVAMSSPRPGLLLPMAVADNNNQPSSFQISNIDGCATLGTQVDPSVLKGKGWDGKLEWVGKGCGKTLERRTVPTITLATILTQWLGGKTVAFMHVDVQGSEMSVVHSAGEHVQQIERMMLEVPMDACVTLTQGAPSCDETLATMRSMGFETEEAFCTNNKGQPATLERGFNCSQIPRHGYPWSTNCKCETDILFVRKNVQNRWQDADSGIGKR